MDYGKTLNLPETEFPMRAGLPQREPDFLKFWQENDIYNKKQNKSTIGNTIIGDDGLLKAGIVTFPNDEIAKKYAIFDTTKSSLETTI